MTTVFSIDAPVELRLTSAAARNLAFVGAMRHSRMVKRLRAAIILSVTAMLGGFVLISLINPFAAHGAKLESAGLSVEGTQLVMSRPVLSGFSRDGKPYSLHAAKASQDAKLPGRVALEGVNARMDTADNSTLQLSANTGLYETTAEKMHVNGDVHLSNAAYDVQLKSANMDFKSGLYRSDESVLVTIKGGTTVSADSVIAADSGKVLTFVGRVHSHMIPQASDANDESAK